MLEGLRSEVFDHVCVLIRHGVDGIKRLRGKEAIGDIEYKDECSDDKDVHWKTQGPPSVFLHERNEKKIKGRKRIVLAGIV